MLKLCSWNMGGRCFAIQWDYTSILGSNQRLLSKRSNRKTSGTPLTLDIMKCGILRKPSKTKKSWVKKFAVSPLVMTFLQLWAQHQPVLTLYFFVMIFFTSLYHQWSMMFHGFDLNPLWWRKPRDRSAPMWEHTRGIPRRSPCGPGEPHWRHDTTLTFFRLKKTREISHGIREKYGRLDVLMAMKPWGWAVIE